MYVILRGKGIMHIGDETAESRGGHVIYISAGATQRIKNTGSENSVFFCVSLIHHGERKMKGFLSDFIPAHEILIL